MGKSKRQQYYEAVSKFIQKGQTKRFSPCKQRRFDKIVQNWSRAQETQQKQMEDIKFGRMRHEAELNSDAKMREWSEQVSKIEPREVKPKNGLEFSKDEYGELRKHWIHDYQDVFQEQPEQLPPH